MAMTRTRNLRAGRVRRRGSRATRLTSSISATGRALVVDPARHPRRRTWPRPNAEVSTSRSTVETHLHADFVSGSPRARRSSAPRCSRLGAAGHGFAAPRRRRRRRGRPRRPRTARRWPPQATRPSTSLICCCDGPTPLALFSGGSLLVDAVGPHRPHRPRPDRTAGPRAVAVAARADPDPPRRPARVPDPRGGVVLLRPGRRERGPPPSDDERAANPLLAAPDEDAFVKQLLAGFGTYPPYFLRLRGREPARPAVVRAADPSASAARRRRRARACTRGGASVVDVRPVDAFARGHVPGADVDRAATAVRHLARLARRRRHDHWCSSLDDDQDRGRARPPSPQHRLRDTSLGELDGGIDAWTRAGNQVDDDRARRRGRAERAPCSTSARTTEFAAGHLPGAVNIELGVDRREPTPPAGPVAVMCGHGERAMTAASLLARAGRRDVDGAHRRSRGLGRHDRQRRSRPAHDDHRPRRPSGSGCAQNLAQFALLVGGQRARRRDDRPGTHRPAPARRARSSGSTAFTAALTFIARVRRGEGGHQLLRRHPVGPLRPQTRPRRRLAHRAPRAAPADVGAVVGLGRSFANVLLGVNQGLTWSTTVIMKIDLAGPERRGLAMGFNEAAGYGAVAVTALATGYIAEHARAAARAVLPRPRLRRTRTRPVDAVRPRDPRPRPPRSRRPRRRHDERPRRAHAPARCSSSPASGRRPCRRAARPGWSTTSTTASRGACSPSVFADAGLSRRTHRRPRRPLPRRVGTRPARHRRAVGPDRPQAAHRRRHAHPGGRHRPDRRHARLLAVGARRRRCSAPAPRWCTRRCSPPSATSPTRAGGPARSASTGCGATAGSPSAPLLAGVLADACQHRRRHLGRRRASPPRPVSSCRPHVRDPSAGAKWLDGRSNRRGRARHSGDRRRAPRAVSRLMPTTRCT